MGLSGSHQGATGRRCSGSQTSGRSIAAREAVIRFKNILLFFSCQPFTGIFHFYGYPGSSLFYSNDNVAAFISIFISIIYQVV